MSLLSAAAFVGVPGFSFTWRMNLLVPCSKRPDPAIRAYATMFAPILCVLLIKN